MKQHNASLRTLKRWLFNATLLLCCALFSMFARADVLDDEQTPALVNQAQIDNINASRLISLNFNNIPTRQLLQVFAQFTGLNFVVSDSVKGSMSVHLNKIPWTEALSVILKSQGLAQQRHGKIILVAPIAELAKHKIQTIEAEQKLKKLQRDSEIQALEAQEKMQQLAPMYNAIITLKYAKAADIAKTLVSAEGSLLAPRGQVSVDSRTNSLWVRASLEKLQKVRSLIQQLDFPVKQVVIEARIVDITRSYEKELGVRFGISNPRHLAGTLAAANNNVAGTPATTTPATLNYTDRLNFDMPATNLFTRPWSIGLAVARLGGNTLLDLELSAMEQEGKIQLISTPSLVTADNQPAYIRTGQEIPYQTATSSGATAIDYKHAELSLEVTPQIVSNNRVVLNLKISNNSQGTVVTLSGGGQAIPINTQEEKSQVLLNNGQTIVLGGIYTQDKRKTMTRTPFLSNIPILGFFFRHKEMRDTRRELLIFLTPKIITRPALYTKTPEQQVIFQQSKSQPVVKMPPRIDKIQRLKRITPDQAVLPRPFERHAVMKQSAAAQAFLPAP